MPRKDALRRSALVLAAVSCLILTGQTYFKEMPEVERVCVDGKPPSYGRLSKLPGRYPTVEYAPGQKEYDRLARLLPEPPEGWSSEPPTVSVSSTDITPCAVQAGRVFTRDGRNIVIGVMVSPMAEFWKTELKKPKQRADPTMRLISHKGYDGYSLADSVTVIAGSALVMVSGGATEAERSVMLDRIDLAAIAALKP